MTLNCAVDKQDIMRMLFRRVSRVRATRQGADFIDILGLAKVGKAVLSDIRRGSFEGKAPADPAPLGL